MQSRSKTPVSPGEAQQIVRRHLGMDCRIVSFEELKDGYFNASYKIGLADGFTCVLKVAPAATVPVLSYERGIMSAEVEAMRLVRNRTAMPVPEIFHHDASGAVIPNEHYLMAYVPGISLHNAKQQHPDNDFDAAERQVGRLLAQMHAITGNRFGYLAPTAKRHDRWRTAFAEMVEGVLADGEALDVSLPLSYGDIRSRLEWVYPALDQVHTPCLVHWDLWDGNIFVNPQTGDLTGIIDFERAMWADPLIEQNFIGKGANASFLAGYGKVMPASRDEHVRRILYNIHLFLLVVIEHYYRKYPTNELEQWGRSRLLDMFDKLERI